MNFRHAIGFLGVGLLLAWLPQLAPGWVASAGTGGSTRSLWLHVMSWVQMGIGGAYLLSRLGSTLASLLAYMPPLPVEEISADAAQPVPMRMLRAQPGRILPVATAEAGGPVPEFEAGLLEQQRAA